MNDNYIKFNTYSYINTSTVSLIFMVKLQIYS